MAGYFDKEKLHFENLPLSTLEWSCSNLHKGALKAAQCSEEEEGLIARYLPTISFYLHLFLTPAQKILHLILFEDRIEESKVY